MTFAGIAYKLRSYSSPFRFSVALLAGCLIHESSSAAAPQEFTATYKAKYSGISITATRSLKALENGDQVFSFEADSWVASIEESSQFNWDEDNRIVPKHYHYQREGLGRDRIADVKFDWDKHTVVNDVERKPWEMNVPDYALDKLSYQLQLRADLINQKPLLEYDIADGGRLKKYRFEILGEELVETKAGTFSTVKVRRIREQKDDKKRHTVLWLAKNWDYLIIRLQQKGDGKSYEIDITEATLNGIEVHGQPS